MEIRNLCAFLKVVSTMNITRAAEALGYSQSNISNQIQQLEEELGIKLFDRIGRGLVLTQYGKNLIPYAEQVIASISALESFMRSDAELTGSIHIGFVESVFNVCGEEILIRFTKRFPKTKIKVTVDSTSILKKQLQKNEIDVACTIDTELPSSKLECPYYKDVEVLLVASSTNLLSEKETLTPQDFKNAKFVLMEDDAPYNLIFNQRLYDCHKEIEPTISLQSCEMAKRMAMLGDFVTLLPEFVVKEVLEEKRLSILKMDWEKIEQKVQIIHAKNKFMTPQINGFIKESENVFDLII